MKNVNILKIIARQAENSPNSPACKDQKESLTYGELMMRAASYAEGLSILQPGSHIALLTGNSCDAVALYLAIFMHGSVCVPLNTQLHQEALEYQINHAECAGIIAEPALLRKRKEAFSIPLFTAKQTIAALNSIQLFPDKKSPFELPHISEEQLAEIVYTSGSTGKPKGVMLSHRNLCSNMFAIIEYLNMDQNDRMLSILPHFYIYGKSLILTQLFCGGSIVFDNRFMYPNLVLDALNEEKATGFAGVPATFSLLLSRSDIRIKKFPWLRYVTQAGGKMAVSQQKEITSILPDVDFFVMYGATEAAPRLSYLPAEKNQIKKGSVGIPVAGVELAIMDEDGNKLPQGSEGQLAARGPNIMQGYLKDQEETEKVIKNGWYLTGDLGYMDEDGYFFITGRAKEFIKVKGHRVSTVEIEEAVLQDPAVEEAAVVPEFDEQKGEIPALFICIKPGAQWSEQRLLANLGKQLASYKLPGRITLLDSMPKNGSGKIDKPGLQKMTNTAVVQTK
jgi:long-chain acyl-CoA synthetase